jgi:hypothetical protein
VSRTETHNPSSSTAEEIVKLSRDAACIGSEVCYHPSIWQRHDLETFQKRLQGLETKAAAENLVFTENQLQALDKARVEKEAAV